MGTFGFFFGHQIPWSFKAEDGYTPPVVPPTISIDSPASDAVVCPVFTTDMTITGASGGTLYLKDQDSNYQEWTVFTGSSHDASGANVSAPWYPNYAPNCTITPVYEDVADAEDGYSMIVQSGANPFTFYTHFYDMPGITPSGTSNSDINTFSIDLLELAGGNDWVRIDLGSAHAYYQLSTGNIGQTGGAKFLYAKTVELSTDNIWTGAYRCILVTQAQLNVQQASIQVVPADGSTANTTGTIAARKALLHSGPYGAISLRASVTNAAGTDTDDVDFRIRGQEAHLVLPKNRVNNTISDGYAAEEMNILAVVTDEVTSARLYFGGVHVADLSISSNEATGTWTPPNDVSDGYMYVMTQGDCADVYSYPVQINWRYYNPVADILSPAADETVCPLDFVIDGYVDGYATQAFLQRQLPDDTWVDVTELTIGAETGDGYYVSHTLPAWVFVSISADYYPGSNGCTLSVSDGYSVVSPTGDYECTFEWYNNSIDGSADDVPDGYDITVVTDYQYIDGYDWIKVIVGNEDSTDGYSYFDINNGTVGETGGTNFLNSHIEANGDFFRTYLTVSGVEDGYYHTTVQASDTDGGSVVQNDGYSFVTRKHVVFVEPAYENGWSFGIVGKSPGGYGTVSGRDGYISIPWLGITSHDPTGVSTVQYGAENTVSVETYDGTGGANYSRLYAGGSFVSEEAISSGTADHTWTPSALGRTLIKCIGLADDCAVDGYSGEVAVQVEFDPVEDDSCIMYHDSTEDVTDDGYNASAWADLTTSNIDLAQADADEQPHVTYKTSTGQPMVTFDVDATIADTSSMTASAGKDVLDVLHDGSGSTFIIAFEQFQCPIQADGYIATTSSDGATGPAIILGQNWNDGRVKYSIRDGSDAVVASVDIGRIEPRSPTVIAITLDGYELTTRIWRDNLDGYSVTSTTASALSTANSEGYYSVGINGAKSAGICIYKDIVYNEVKSEATLAAYASALLAEMGTRFTPNQLSSLVMRHDVCAVIGSNSSGTVTTVRDWVNADTNMAQAGAGVGPYNNTVTSNNINLIANGSDYLIRSRNTTTDLLHKGNVTFVWAGVKTGAYAQYRVMASTGARTNSAGHPGMNFLLGSTGAIILRIADNANGLIINKVIGSAIQEDDPFVFIYTLNTDGYCHYRLTTLGSGNLTDDYVQASQALYTGASEFGYSLIGAAGTTFGNTGFLGACIFNEVLSDGYISLLEDYYTGQLGDKTGGGDIPIEPVAGVGIAHYTDEGVTNPSGDYVSQLDDQAGSIDVAQATQANQPLLNTESYNGVNNIYFESADYLSYTGSDANKNCLHDGTGCTLFVCAAFDTITSGSSSTLLFTGVNPGFNFKYGKSGSFPYTQIIVFNASASVVMATSLINAPQNAMTLYTLRWGNSYGFNYMVNGTVQQSGGLIGTPSTSNSAYYEIGGAVSPMALGAILVYPSILTDAQCTTMENYLSNKYIP